MMVTVMISIKRGRNRQQQMNERQTASRLRTLHGNINPRAAAPVMMMWTTAADACVHQQRITGPTNTSLNTALNGFLELIEQ